MDQDTRIVRGAIAKDELLWILEVYRRLLFLKLQSIYILTIHWQSHFYFYENDVLFSE